MSLFKKIAGKLTAGNVHLTWKLVMVNVLVIAVVIWLAGVSVKDFACLLVGQYHLIGEEKNRLFNQTMQFYLLRASVLALVVAAGVHFLFIRRILAPLKRLTRSAQLLKQGTYPEPLEMESKDEIGQLTKHFNEMTQTLKRTEDTRKRMLGNISHDLRTPLSNLNGYLEALESGVLEGNRELYRSLLEESRHMTRLVDQLHQLAVWESRPSARPAGTILNMQDLLAGCIQTFAWKYRKKTARLHASVEAAAVIGDENGIKQVAGNLLENALLYNTGKDTWIKGETDGRFYRVSVTNWGQPIPAEMREQLFERFFRADPSRHRDEEVQGTGLGLAIVKEIVEQLGGSTGLDSDGRKHTFWFTVPRSSSFAPTGEEAVGRVER